MYLEANEVKFGIFFADVATTYIEGVDREDRQEQIYTLPIVSLPEC